MSEGHDGVEAQAQGEGAAGHDPYTAIETFRSASLEARERMYLSQIRAAGMAFSELSEARRTIAALSEALRRLSDIRPEVMYNEGGEAAAWYACCGGSVEPGMDDEEGHNPGCPWWEARQALQEQGPEQPTNEGRRWDDAFWLTQPPDRRP